MQTIRRLVDGGSQRIRILPCIFRERLRRMADVRGTFPHGVQCGVQGIIVPQIAAVKDVVDAIKHAVQLFQHILRIFQQNIRLCLPDNAADVLSAAHSTVILASGHPAGLSAADAARVIPDRAIADAAVVRAVHNTPLGKPADAARIRCRIHVFCGTDRIEIDVQIL